ncbi:hypothetical protein SRABI106_03913 [Rahnella aquatilis]|nr:hypothetical protein SRABI106_03913 [Rahnella aquatilis]
MTLLNIFEFLYCRIELFKHIRGAAIEGNLNKYQQRCVQIMRVEQCSITIDEALTFKTTNALQTWSWR